MTKTSRLLDRGFSTVVPSYIMNEWLAYLCFIIVNTMKIKVAIYSTPLIYIIADHEYVDTLALQTHVHIRTYVAPCPCCTHLSMQAHAGISMLQVGKTCSPEIKFGQFIPDVIEAHCYGLLTVCNWWRPSWLKRLACQLLSCYMFAQEPIAPQFIPANYNVLLKLMELMKL